MSNKTHAKLPDETESAPKYSRFRPYVYLLAFLVLIAFFFSFTAVLSDGGYTIKTPAGRISLEIADSPLERSLGLSGRDSIADDKGLLFIFDDTSIENCFWMKDMKFAIDMVWINENSEVITVISNVSPETYPDNFCPDKPAKYGLELSSGNAERLQITSGIKLR